jgi:exosortase D (VPLPA-CTERM-specific)
VGLLILLCSGVFYLTGQVGSVETLTYMSIWMAILGLSFLLFGVRVTKALAFPLLVLAFIVPLPPFLNRLFTFELKLISSSLSVKMIHMMGLSAYREGNMIDLGLTQLQVVDACSGLRYVYPLLLMALLLGYFFHKKWWKRALILLASIPVSVLSNALRIAITGFLAAKVSPQAAEAFFHGFSGWLIFMVSFVLLATLSLLFKIGKPETKQNVSVSKGKNRHMTHPFQSRQMRQSYIWIASLIFVGFWGLHSALASSQIIPERKHFDGFPTLIGEWKGQKSYLREEILAELWADDYMQIQFSNASTGDSLLLFVSYYEYQGTRHTAHSPVSCLIGGGFSPRSSEIIRREFPQPFGQVRVKKMVLEKNQALLLSNYWFQQRGRVVVSEYVNKWYLFWDSLSKHRTDGALVRIEMPLRRSQNVEEAQAVIDTFVGELMMILPEYVPN